MKINKAAVLGLVVIIAAVFLFISAQNKASIAEIPDDDKIFSRWLSFYKISRDDLALQSSAKISIDDIWEYKKEDLDKDKYLQIISKMSENGKYAVSILGYGAPSYDKKSKKWSLEFEPDSCIFLIDLARNKLLRINFTGTPMRYEDINWINNNEFYVLGIMTDEASKGQPMKVVFIDIFNISKKKYSTFTYNFERSPPQYLMHENEIIKKIGRTLDKKEYAQ